MCHKPFHNHSIHTCTFFQSLHNGVEGVCVAGHRGWERKNRPEKENESVQTGYQMRCFVSFYWVSNWFFFSSFPRERQESKQRARKKKSFKNVPVLDGGPPSPRGVQN